MNYQSVLQIVNIVLSGQFNPIADYNQDNTIDVLDVILVINFIMDISSPNNQENLLSDMNADGYINIQDIILIVNIILNN